MSRDKNNVAFMSYEQLPKFQGSQDIDSSIYDKVFEGNVDCKTLEDVYVMFNRNHPEGYKARSLSKSDVVEIIAENGNSEFHYCDSIGYKEVQFEPDKCKISNRFFDMNKTKPLKILLVEPNKYPRTVYIDDTLEAMQKVVGGDIEEYMPFEDEVAIICNEEGKLIGLPLNRAIYAEPETVEMPYNEMTKCFREAEEKGIKHEKGYIVFSQDSFEKPYTEEQRTYVISSDNKAFQPSMGGYSIFGSCLDGTDPCVRLDSYMRGENAWKIEKCYMKHESKEMIEIMAGTFFIAYAPYESEKFLSLPDNLEAKYKKKFKYPERFIKADNEIVAVPFKPTAKDKER